MSYAQDMLQRMGLSRTVVADASGFSPATVSTPSELVAIGIAALKNPVIAEIVAQPQAQIPGIGIIKNTNQLLGTDGVIGIKTGTTDEAGHCLLFAARHAAEDGQKVTIVGVIMGDKNATSLYRDSRDLLESAKQGWSVRVYGPSGRNRDTSRMESPARGAAPWPAAGGRGRFRSRGSNPPNAAPRRGRPGRRKPLRRTRPQRSPG